MAGKYAEFAQRTGGHDDLGLFADDGLFGGNHFESNVFQPFIASFFELRLGHLLGRFEHFFNAAFHVEGLLGDTVVHALTDLLEGTNRIFDFDVFTRLAGKGFRHMERLGEEALDLAGPLDGEFVLIRTALPYPGWR